MAALAEGDRSRLNSLYARHAQRVYTLSWRMTGDKAIAEEITQEVFTRVWDKANQYSENKGKFSSWVNRMASNLCVDNLRKKKESLVETIEDLEVSEASNNPEQQMIQQRHNDQLQYALLLLPERQRLALTLTVYLEQSNAEAGMILDITEQATESLLARARRTLRKTLLANRENLDQGETV
jgi:RNA polymerase sigma-70 factor (ECF subfamily)